VESDTTHVDMADHRVLLGIVLVVLAWACCSMLTFVSSSMTGSLHSTELLSVSEAPEESPELRPLGVWSQIPERICDTIYPISSSPYHSEDIHTKITMVLLKGVMTLG
jgi:hypothetical protein